MKKTSRNSSQVVESTQSQPIPPVRVVRILPDVPALEREFHYVVPDSIPEITVGDVVRIPLRGRRVRGWVVALDDEPPQNVELAAVAKRSGFGPTQELLHLSMWAAWRWAGPRVAFLRAATPQRNVQSLPHSGNAATASPQASLADTTGSVKRFAEIFDHPVSLLRLGPNSDRVAVARAAANLGHALILVPSLAQVASLGRQLTQLGYNPAIYPNDWAQIRAGSSLVIGSRAAAFAPMTQLDAVVVFDEHDEVWQEEAAPTWHARDVVIERAKTAGAPVLLVSPTPSLEALEIAHLRKVSRTEERNSWPRVTIIDRRHEDPKHKSLWSDAVVPYLRGPAPVVCMLNRLGRARLLACKSCGSLATCETCGSSMEQFEHEELRCRQCASVRPVVCHHCGGSGFKNLRVGLSRAHEELEALIKTKAVEVSASQPFDPRSDAHVVIGTEAVLHQINRAATVVFLDFDQELLAARYRATEEALALLVRAARLVGRHHPPGSIVVQTRLPEHEVLKAVRHGDPELWSTPELARRHLLNFPPASALAEVSGAAAAAYINALVDREEIEILGPTDGRWLLRAANSEVLANFLAKQQRPSGRLRVAVDPPRV